MILLAAGNSSRFGENKLLYEIGGKPMFEHAVERALLLKNRGLLCRVVLVTQYESVADRAAELGAEIVWNDRPDLGISRSLSLGLAHVLAGEPEVAACIFGVCDQPYLSDGTIASLIDLFSASGKGMAACACPGAAGGAPGDGAGDPGIGNPVIFAKQYFPELLALTGDRGGKQVVLRHPEDVALLPTDPRELEDLDTRPAERDPLFYRLDAGGELVSASAGEVFPFLTDGERHVISLVGGGGKSSLMDLLAREFMRRGRAAVRTTTTHILQPAEPEFVPVQDLGLEILRARLAQGQPCTVGTPEVSIGPDGERVHKLTALSPLLLAAVIEAADVTIIEADGAKRLPVKAPANHEPVIHPATDIVIAVLGLSALGRPLSEVCFRPEKVLEIVGDAADGSPADPARERLLLTEKELAAIFLSERGGRKGVGARSYYCVANQCDNEKQRESAALLLRRLSEGGVTDGIASRLK